MNPFYSRQNIASETAGSIRSELIASKVLLPIAAAWNILGGTMALLDPARHLSRMYYQAFQLSEPFAEFFFRCTWINVIAWGVGYLLAAFIPTARTPILAAGGIGKIAYFLACAALFRSGVGKPAILATGVCDVLFAAAFAWILLGRRASRQITAGGSLTKVVP
jgi:hypothetical protein